MKPQVQDLPGLPAETPALCRIGGRKNSVKRRFRREQPPCSHGRADASPHAQGGEKLGSSESGEQSTPRGLSRCWVLGRSSSSLLCGSFSPSCWSVSPGQLLGTPTAPGDSHWPLWVTDLWVAAASVGWWRQPASSPVWWHSGTRGPAA